MNRLLFLLLLLPLGWSSYAQGQTIAMGPLQLLLADARSEDFRLVISGHTYTIQPVEQSPLDSAYIMPTAGAEILEVEERLVVDFLQETVDDERAFYIGAPHEYVLKASLPQGTYRPRSLDDVELLPAHLAKADRASRLAQHKYYTNLLAHEADYRDSHPEYILQAKYFLPKTKTLPFDELNIHPSIRERKIRVRYRSGGGEGIVDIRQTERARERD